jgi:hypothetical protein
MAPRLRQCIECPKCATRYLLGFNHYDNGSYLVSMVTESSEDYQLFCSCGAQPLSTRWSWQELKTYAVFHDAYERGYGTPGEILLYREREARVSRI